MSELFGQYCSRKQTLRRIGHLSQVGVVQLLSFADGPARNVRSLEFRTGSGLIFKVAPDRGWSC